MTKENANRPEFLGQNWDISGATCRALHFSKINLNYLHYLELNKPEYNLTNSDIEKSKPQCQRFFTSRQPSNPLNPEYKLSKVEYREVTPPKFIRD